MAFNGSGTYNLPAGNPVVTGTTISSTWANNTLQDIATALTNCITRDGQSPATANIPMGNYKITGLNQASNPGDALMWGGNIEVATATIDSLSLTAPLDTASGGTGLSAAGTANHVLVSDGTDWQSKAVTLPIKNYSGSTISVTLAFA